MTMHSVTVNLPPRIYERMKQQARDKNRSIEDEVTAVVESAVALGPEWTGIPTDLADEAMQLKLLDDDHLWRVARMTLPTEKSERMHHVCYRTREEAKTDIFFYIESFYNRRRRHSSLGCLSPLAYEASYHEQAAVMDHCLRPLS